MTDVSIKVIPEQEGPQKKVKVTLKNEGDSIAFTINLHLLDQESGSSVLPVFWEDNIISLLPGEERSVYVTAQSARAVKMSAAGWNTNILQKYYKEINLKRMKHLAIN